jgi:hypothetical protein
MSIDRCTVEQTLNYQAHIERDSVNSVMERELSRYRRAEPKLHFWQTGKARGALDRTQPRASGLILGLRLNRFLTLPV